MPVIGWHREPYVFGDGLRVTTGSTTFEIIPYIREDGSGRVAGHALAVDLRIVRRVPGPIAAAIAAAEGLILGRGEAS